MSTSKVPIRSIFNSNVAFVRDDPTIGLDELIADIKKNGLMFPILLAPDFQVLDGARRLHAYKALGEKEISVTVANNWSQIREYFTKINKAEKEEGAPYRPMTWFETIYLTKNLLPNFYVQERIRLANLARKRNKETGQRSPKHSDKYASDIRSMFHFKNVHTYKVLCDIDAAILRLAHDRELQETLRERIRHIESTTGQLYAAWGLARATAKNGSFTDESVLIPAHDVRQAKEQHKQLSGIADVLDHVATDALRMGPLNPAFSPEELRALVSRLQRANRRIAKFVRECDKTSNNLWRE